MTQYTVLERFLKYVQIDTQSDPSSSSCPSTEKQKDLARLLVSELLEMGISDAEMDENGYVYGTLPSNSSKSIPVICFCSHMDTSPDCSGAHVKPIIHKNYQGQDLILPADPNIILKPSDHPSLLKQIGNDIVTADGSTLLGADNKAGVAEIMDAVYQMIHNPSIKHGTIKILFTPDEEIGRGVEKVNLEKVGAKYAYTMDGEEAGHIENETFSADAMTLTIHGVPIHPGYAKGKLKNAIKIASEIVESLPKDTLSPETTEGKQGFIHPTHIQGNIETAVIQLIIRDFSVEGLHILEKKLQTIAEQVVSQYPEVTLDIHIQEQYRNMKEILDTCPFVTEYAVEAVKRAGLNPVLTSIRGGTDGSRLSFMNLPCPNIFAGEHAFHSKKEWVSVFDMQKAVDTIIHLCQIWEEKA